MTSDQPQPTAQSGEHMRYARVWRAVQSVVWAIEPTKLESVLEILSLRTAGERFSEDEIAQRLSRAGVQTRTSDPATVLGGGVAVIPIQGTITQRPSLFSRASGGCSTMDVSEELRAALADPAVGSILLDIDSPGGTVDGVPELAAEIYGARGKKPIVALANTMAASAAYWLGTAADELLVTPSGMVGSVGAFMVHQDLSRLYDAAGITHTIVSAGKFKTLGNSFSPLGEEGRAYFQSIVSEGYAAFTRDVAKHRDVAVEEVRNGYGEGKVLTARQALKLEMVDGIATYDEAIARLLGTSPSGARTSRAAVAPTPVITGAPAPVAQTTWDLPRSLSASPEVLEALKAAGGLSFQLQQSNRPAVPAS